MDEIFDRIKATKINKKYLAWSLIFTEILGIITLVWYLKAPLSKKFLESDPEAYSVVSMNPDKRYLASQGDYLAGKAIPNTLIKVLLTPGNSLFSLRADSNGDWRFQIPESVQKQVFRFTFGNFDVNNKLVTFRSYKVRVESNNQLLQNTDKLWRRLTFSPQNAYAQTRISTTFNYGGYSLPQPNGLIELTEDEKYRLENYFLPYAYPASQITGADWRLMAMWIFTEDYLTNYMDNCLDGNKDWGEDADANQNTACTGWTKNGSPNWQVGWGIMPHHWVDRLPEAMAIMRPGETIQQIGQRVINESYEQDRYPTRGIVAFKPPSDPITNPKFFPEDVTLDQIIQGSKPVGDGIQTKPCPRSESDLKNFTPDQDPIDCDMRQLLGILMKDPAISAYFLGLMWKDIADKGSLPQYFAGWGPERNAKGQIQNPYINTQKISNTIAALENAVSGLNIASLSKGPRVTVPAATAQELRGPIEMETIISEDGAALDDAQLNERNLRVETVVLPLGTNPVDFGYGATPENYTYQPNSQSNVKGVSTISQLTLDTYVTESPTNYQICKLLLPTGYETVISYSCVPVSDIIDPQIPVDNSTTPIPQSIEVVPDSSILNDSSLTSCEPRQWVDENAYSCENGFACYNKWKISGGNSCEQEPDYGEDGNWFICLPDDSCAAPIDQPVIAEEQINEPVYEEPIATEQQTESQDL